eukprot:SAG31_NODE_2529_length_5556_cov_114.211472_4_plen_91_part_00
MIIQLQGFIFFFTAEKLRKKLIAIIEMQNENNADQVLFLILDFRMVNNMDATSLKKIKKLLRFLRDLNITLLLSNLGTLEVRLHFSSNRF